MNYVCGKHIRLLSHSVVKTGDNQAARTKVTFGAVTLELAPIHQSGALCKRLCIHVVRVRTQFSREMFSFVHIRRFFSLDSLYRSQLQQNPAGCLWKYGKRGRLRTGC